MKNGLKFLSFLLVAGIIASLAFTNAPAGNGYKIGDTATDFSLKGTDGKMHSMADYKDAKGYIIIFTCNHCPYAKMYEQRIIDLHNKYAKKGYPVIAINPNDPEVVPDDSFEAMQTIAKEKSYPFNYLLDDKQSVYPKFGATKTPHVFVLDKKKKVRYIGGIDDKPKSASDVTKKYVEMAIEAIEKGKDPDPATTVALGCSIKTK